MVIHNTCQHNTLYVDNPTYFAPKTDQSQNSKKFPNSEKRIAPFETRNNGKTVPFELSQRRMYFPLFQTHQYIHYHTPKQRKIKFKARIKLNHIINKLKAQFLCSLRSSTRWSPEVSNFCFFLCRNIGDCISIPKLYSSSAPLWPNQCGTYHKSRDPICRASGQGEHSIGKWRSRKPLLTDQVIFN